MYGFVLCDIAFICQYWECTNRCTKLISLENPDWILVQILHQDLLWAETHVSELFQALFLLKRETWTEVSCFIYFFASNSIDGIICNPIFWKELVHAQKFQSSLFHSLSKLLYCFLHTALCSWLSWCCGPCCLLSGSSGFQPLHPSPNPFSSVEREILPEKTRTWPQKGVGLTLSV